MLYVKATVGVRMKRDELLKPVRGKLNDGLMVTT
jgi:hypothetical protein